MDAINIAVSKGIKSISVDFFDLTRFDPDLAEMLLDEPEEVIKAAELAVEQFDVGKPLRVRFFNFPESAKVLIRNIRSIHLNKFIALEGIIRQASNVRPEVVSARFECPSCGNVITLQQTENKFREPTRCTCGRKGKFRLLSKDLVDAQRLVVEESTQSLEGGAEPKRLSIFLREDLVEPYMEKKTTPGKNVLITGVLQEVPIPARDGGISTRFEIVMNCNHIDTVEEDFTDIVINEEDEAMIKSLAKEKGIYEKLTASMAPSIFGHDKIKEALVLQMMGGVRKKKIDGTIIRGDIHMLLVGDPGAGKSALLTFIKTAAPKARYIAGRSTSGAGITATVVKDEFLRGWALEAGAIVLADRGVLVLDEMDKMSKEDTSALHEGMEQQSYHPDFEIMFSDATKKKIGDFVDDLMDKNKNKIVQGNDCEILPVDNYEVLTTDFNKIKPIKVNRVSRHKAPNYFIEVEFTNGRKVQVTPEHPFFVFTEDGYTEVGAEDLGVGMHIPAPRKLLTKKKDGTIETIDVSKTLIKLLNDDLGLVQIKSLGQIKNSGEKWVYDVTVEPNHTFVSEGLVLHNTITIAKANIQATLRAQTTILAAANPKLGRFDPFAPLGQQIDLPPALINRFDLIFVLRDLPDRVKDEKIAHHVLMHQSYQGAEAEIPPENFRKYIAYVKQRIFPVLTDEAMGDIKKFYVELRNAGTSGDDALRPIPISARQLEAIVRLAEGSARIRLSDKVEKKDVARSISLLRYCLNEIGMDPETGQIDIDRIGSGITASDRGKIISVRDIIYKLDEGGKKTIPMDDILEEAEKKGISEQKVEEAIDKLKRQGDIFQPKQGFVQKI
jgi:replicative DNA helicase Mcm